LTKTEGNKDIEEKMIVKNPVVNGKVTTDVLLAM
jgi:hypothetical protein